MGSNNLSRLGAQALVLDLSYYLIRGSNNANWLPKKDKSEGNWCSTGLISPILKLKNFLIIRINMMKVKVVS